jgi:hypothetical protein
MYFDTSLKTSLVDLSALSNPLLLSRIGNFFLTPPKNRIFRREERRWTGTTEPVIKVHYQAFFWVLIDLIVELLGLIINPFDNQTKN